MERCGGCKGIMKRPRFIGVPPCLVDCGVAMVGTEWEGCQEVGRDYSAGGAPI